MIISVTSSFILASEEYSKQFYVHVNQTLLSLNSFVIAVLCVAPENSASVMRQHWHEKFSSSSEHSNFEDNWLPDPFSHYLVVFVVDDFVLLFCYFVYLFVFNEEAFN